MKLSTLLATTAVLCALAAGACSKESSNPGTPTCSVSPGTASTTTFGVSGGTGTVAVTAGSGCAWTSVSNASFITITQGATGSGNGTVAFTVAANPGATRTGTMTVAGTTITISQAGGDPPPPQASFSAPTPVSPIGGVTIDTARPTLTVNNAGVTGTPGTVTYRFEVSDQSSFPNDPARTFSVEGVAQGNGTTGGVIPRDLGPSVLWYWHARATNGNAVGPYSATETFRTASVCSFTLSTTAIAAATSGDSQTVTVTTGSACSWTATSNASFITVASGASGTGNGTVTLTIAANTGGARTGTVTIAGQTVTVTQGETGLVVGFRMIDNGRGPQPVTECQIRSQTNLPNTCTLESTSFPLGTNGITGYQWTVEYVYPFAKTLTGTNPTIALSEGCGFPPSSQTGELVDLNVTLTVTDSSGTSVTVRSGSGSQPTLKLRVFTCGF